MKLLENRVAIVSGAAQGIGQAIAEVFAEHGAAVVIADLNLEKAGKVATEIAKGSGSHAMALYVNVADKASVKAMVDETMHQFGCIDILVNNAGILRPHYIIDLTEEDWDAVFDVNAKGTFLCSQAVAKVMIQQRSGVIINISSASGKKPDPKGAAYCSSKSAIIGFTRVLALELGPYGIRANAICPGATDTEMLRAVCEAVPGFYEQLVARTALGKIATPRDQANMALFLASDLASHVTGEAILVAGGELMGE